MKSVPDIISTKRNVPDSKVHGANMGPTWVLSAPDGPHVGSMNLAIRGMFALDLFFIQTLDCVGGTIQYTPHKIL